MPSHWIVTGADSSHFVNSRMLVASWWETNRELPLAYCDFGLTPEQVTEVRSWPVTFFPIPPELKSATHPWRRKAGLIQYIADLGWNTLIWVDADAILLHPLHNVGFLLEGYDLLIDAHRMAIGEIMRPETAALLPPLDARDAYFSSGFWITTSPALLNTWDKLCASVVGVGNLWENDAFVAAVYAIRPHMRTVCGNIWHVRGVTSLQTADFTNGRLAFAGYPCVVLHANAEYTLREDGRRVFTRRSLREVQDRLEQRFFELRAIGFDPSCT